MNVEVLRVDMDVHWVPPCLGRVMAPPVFRRP